MAAMTADSTATKGSRWPPFECESLIHDGAENRRLFVVTALAEIVGCYLPYLWLQKGRSAWLLVPAAISLVAFSWLLTLHPEAAGRVYAAYGGVYITVALAWLWQVDDIRPTVWDVTGVVISLIGMGVIMFAPRSA
jgi:small multidrug resistance family-3 protein